MLREMGKIRREDEHFPLLDKPDSGASASACRRGSLRKIVDISLIRTLPEGQVGVAAFPGVFARKRP